MEQEEKEKNKKFYKKNLQRIVLETISATSISFS